MMLTWEHAGIVLGALLALIRRKERAEVGQTGIVAMPTRGRVFLLCRPIAHILISLLAGLAVQSAGATTIVVIAGGAYPIVVATLTWAIDRKLFFRKPCRKRSMKDVSCRAILRRDACVAHHRWNGKPLPAHKIAEVEKWALQRFSSLFRGGKMTRDLGSYQMARISDHELGDGANL